MPTLKKVTPIRAAITKENAARSMPQRWTDKSRAVYVQYCNADQRANVRKTAAFDSMYADGIRSTDFLAPSNELSTSTDELYADLIRVKVESWGKAATALYYATTAEAKKLPEIKKAKRTKLRSDIGAYLGSDRKAFKTREDLAAGKGEGKGKGKTGAKQPTAPSTTEKAAPNTALANLLQSCKSVAERAESIEGCKDIPAMMMALQMFCQEHLTLSLEESLSNQPRFGGAVFRL